MQKTIIFVSYLVYDINRILTTGINVVKLVALKINVSNQLQENVFVGLLITTKLKYIIS